MITVLAVGVLIWYASKVAVSNVLSYFDIYLRSTWSQMLVNLVPIIFGGIGAYLPYRIEKIRLYLLEVITEVKKVVWPSKKETQAATIVVIIAVIISAIVLGIFDWLSSMGVNFILR